MLNKPKRVVTVQKMLADSNSLTSVYVNTIAYYTILLKDLLYLLSDHLKIDTYICFSNTLIYLR